VIGGKRARNQCWPSKKPQPVKQARLPRARVRRRRENDLGHAVQKILGVFPPVFLLLQIEQNLLDDEAAKTVADENDGSRFETGPAQETFEKIARPVLQGRGGAEPIGCGGFICQRVDRYPLDLLSQPKRPEARVVARRFLDVPAPGIISVAPK